MNEECEMDRREGKECPKLGQEQERIDDIGFSGFRIIQRPKEFCYGIDAVLLSDFAKVKDGGRICDLGTGTGIIPLILRHKTKASEICGIELQKNSYDLALRNVELNGLERELHMFHGDVLDGVQMLGKGCFDTVVTNPPYTAPGEGMKSNNEAKRLARHESTATLQDFVRVAADLLKDKGNFYLVHRPSRLVDIMMACRQYRLEPKLIRMVAPRVGVQPNILLLHCVKYGNPELLWLPTLYVYDGEKGYTKEIDQIYERDKNLKTI